MLKKSIPILVMLLLPACLSGAEEVEQPTVIYKQPIVLTPAGQSAEGFMIRTMCVRLGIDVKYMPMATPDSLENCGTLLFVAGGSSKGLGAAKVDVKDEEVRISKLIKAARKAKIPVLTIHIGGKARRGALSDDFNEIAAEAAELIIVRSDGDADEFFKKIAAKNKAKYISIDQTAEVMGVLKNLFNDKTEETE